ncbi:MAG: helix-turn-helix domain-containing protein [Sedimenticola sp.]
MGNQAQDFSHDPDALLTPKQAAEFLNVSEIFLIKSRYQGKGPVYLKISANRVRYRRRDLLTFQESCAVDPSVKYAE